MAAVGCTTETTVEPAVAKPPSTDASVRLVWWKEIPGLVPAELARDYQRFPYRFSLFGDGTVIYRDEEFQGRRVQLRPAELAELWSRVQQFRAVSLSDAALPEPMRGGTVILDAGHEEFGVHEPDGDQSLSVDLALPYWRREFPDHEGLARWSQLRQLIVSFDHPRAEVWSP
ncbi:MAG: hypothetical protein AAF581_13785 [Planctomycetota bacterium]